MKWLPKYIATMCIFLLGLSYNPALCEQDCKKGVVSSSSDPTAYIKREGDSRCEGMFEKRVSDNLVPELELISLVLGNFHYDLDHNIFLLVSAHENPYATSDKIRIRAIAREEGTNYQLDAFLPKNRPFRWPLRAVLYPEGLQASDIGVYGWFSRGKKKVYIPLFIIPENEPPDQSKQQPVIIVLRTPVDIKNITWQHKGELEPWSAPRTVHEGTLYGGDSLPMKLPASGKGLFQLLIKGQQTNSDDWIWMDEVQIFIPGQ